MITAIEISTSALNSIEVNSETVASIDIQPATPATLEVAIATIGPKGEQGVQGVSGAQGIQGIPGPNTIGGYGIQISTLSVGDQLRFSGNNWENTSQTSLTDGGNF